MKRYSFVFAALLGVGLAALSSTRTLRAQAASIGQWTTLPLTMSINPIHLALMRNGKVLIVTGSGNDHTETNMRAGVWDPQAATLTVQPVTWDMFCNGMLLLADGRPFINGGNLQYQPFEGLARSSIFDPATNAFSDIENMAHGRWYPTVLELGDGRVMTYSGLTETGATNTSVEIYTVGSGWSPEYPSGWTPPLYPRLHLLPNGVVFYSGSGPGSRFFNPSTKTWTPEIATTNLNGTRIYGSAVLLPLRPADNYKPRVMIFGGGSPATVTTEIIDLSSPTPHWTWGPFMTQGRVEMSATILPNGNVLALGGSVNDEDATTATYAADLYNPATNTFTSAGANAFPRLYHSGSLLLPDATVALMGGNPTQRVYEPHVEIYSPAYLFNADGSAAHRPAIGSLSSTELDYGATFQAQSPDAASIAQVVLIRPGAPTHAFDVEQRLVGLNYTVSGDTLTITTPPTANIAPPGYYMLFLLNSAGVPSVASFVHLTASLADQRPTATITSPATDIVVAAGAPVSFTGTGTDPNGSIASYAWSFPGGNPASSTSANPGNVTYSTPGTYVASLSVTDNTGLTSQITDTRLINVVDFSMTAGPASQSVMPGTGTSYTATIAPINGFQGTVSFSVSGLPAGATASFSPATVVGSGSTSMTITTTAALATGSYTLTITARSGPLTHTAAVTFVVGPCLDTVSLSYVPNTFTMNFTLSISTPATWSAWIVVNNTAYSLWSVSVPAMKTPTLNTVPVANFPNNLGVVTIATALQNTSGMLCYDWKTIATGQ